jgi:hypothetical protein
VQPENQEQLLYTFVRRLQRNCQWRAQNLAGIPIDDICEVKTELSMSVTEINSIRVTVDNCRSNMEDHDDADSTRPMDNMMAVMGTLFPDVRSDTEGDKLITAKTTNVCMRVEDIRRILSCIDLWLSQPGIRERWRRQIEDMWALLYKLFPKIVGQYNEGRCEPDFL